MSFYFVLENHHHFSPLPFSSAARLAKSWKDHLTTFVPVTEAQFFAPVRPFLPRIKKTADILAKFTAVNLAVHPQTYNDLIAAAIGKCA